MSVRYEHPRLDLEGIWDRTSCKFTLLFLVIEAESHEELAGDNSRRVLELKRQVSDLIVSPVVELQPFDDVPTANRDHSLQILEEELIDPSGGLMIIEGKYLKPVSCGVENLGKCINITADIYSDLMFERARPDAPRT